MPIRGDDIILVEKNIEKHYAIVTLNREERANAVGFESFKRLNRVWTELQADETIWSIILTGAGDRFFCSGMDLKDRADLEATYKGGYEQYVKDEGIFDMTPQAAKLWKPIIGAINGVAFAGGFMLSQVCDVRIASETARFGIPECRWNLPAPFVAQAQKIVPPAWVMEAIFWGDRQYDAQRMYELGYVNKVVSPEQLMPEAISWAEQLCDMGPVSVWRHKELMYRYLYPDEDSWKRFGLAIFGDVERMEDSVEGPTAFVEKRKPQWKLR